MIGYPIIHETSYQTYHNVVTNKSGCYWSLTHPWEFKQRKTPTTEVVLSKRMVSTSIVRNSLKSKSTTKNRKYYAVYLKKCCKVYIHLFLVYCADRVQARYTGSVNKKVQFGSDLGAFWTLSNVEYFGHRQQKLWIFSLTDETYRK